MAKQILELVGTRLNTTIGKSECGAKSSRVSTPLLLILEGNDKTAFIGKIFALIKRGDYFENRPWRVITGYLCQGMSSTAVSAGSAVADLMELGNIMQS